MTELAVPPLPWRTAIVQGDGRVSMEWRHYFEAMRLATGVTGGVTGGVIGGGSSPSAIATAAPVGIAIVQAADASPVAVTIMMTDATPIGVQLDATSAEPVCACTGIP